MEKLWSAEVGRAFLEVSILGSLHLRKLPFWKFLFSETFSLSSPTGLSLSPIPLSRGTTFSGRELPPPATSSHKISPKMITNLPPTILDKFYRSNRSVGGEIEA